ncbi:hypothetical protein [Massilia puerhi]|uniref:hypothetical protein n=1 Tax=Massilia puerhi TaxID=2681550 RepID=UPI00135CB441|nr:hypothetical protein [Massilia puerhi]
MTDLRWYLPLEQCRGLDAIRRRWRPLLEEAASLPHQDPARHHDALLAFIGRSTLSPHLKLAALLACVDSRDFDLRLALGALDDQVSASRAPWPGSVHDAVAGNGPAMQVASRRDWLGAFVVGRLAGLRDAMVGDGAGVAQWQAEFRRRYAEMALRRGLADAGDAILALGAAPRLVRVK